MLSTASFAVRGGSAVAFLVYGSLNAREYFVNSNGVVVSVVCYYTPVGKNGPSTLALVLLAYIVKLVMLPSGRAIAFGIAAFASVQENS